MVGRYFTFDNDYGEHWFDNWQERDALEEKATVLGYAYDDLLMIDPERFRNGKDGPCHNDEEIKKFWTDVLKSLHLSINTIISEASKFNQEALNRNDSDYLLDLEERIQHVKNKYLIL